MVYYILTYSKYVSKNTILIIHLLISDHLVPATLCEILLLGFPRTSCLSDIVNHKITQAEIYSSMGQHHLPCTVPWDQSSPADHYQSRSHTLPGLNQDKNERFYYQTLVILPLHILASIQRNGLYALCIRNVVTCHCFPSTGLSLPRLRPFAFMTVPSMCSSHCWKEDSEHGALQRAVRSVTVYSGHRN